MNLIVQTPYIRNEKKWYFLSVFYARENWADLITQIMQYYRKRTGQFDTYLFSFSGERGEHLQIAFVSPNDSNNYINEIQAEFQMFVELYPSINSTPFPYGKAIWGNYPNNSLVWNKFRLPLYSDQYIRFHQQTMRVALELMEDDFSEDTIFSVGMYLFTKGLACINNPEQKNVLFQILEEASTDNSNDTDTIKKLINEIDINEAQETMESYRNENASEYSTELINWLDEVEILLKHVNYKILCFFICEILGLTGSCQILILELLYKFL